jgi:hypothetical protein
VKCRRARHATCVVCAVRSDRALCTLLSRTDDVGRPKAVTLGQLAGPQPPRPVWPWAAVSPREHWTFPVFLELFN